MNSINICCTQYNSGRCAHPAAPGRWFGKPMCIEAEPFDSKDSRVGIINRCRVKIPVPRLKYSPSSV